MLNNLTYRGSCQVKLTRRPAIHVRFEPIITTYIFLLIQAPAIN